MSVAAAQSTDTLPPGEPKLDPRSGAAQPPLVLRLAPLENVPAFVSPNQEFEVFAVIDRDGRASFDGLVGEVPKSPYEPQAGADASHSAPPNAGAPAAVDASLRSSIESALAQSEFKPALQDGVPIPAKVRLRLRTAARAGILVPRPSASMPTPSGGAAAAPLAPALAPSAGAAAPSTRPRAETSSAGPAESAPSTSHAAASGAAPAPNALTPHAAAQLSGSPEPEHSYSAIGRIAKPSVTGRRIEERELRELPGAFGDPFRVIEALPGVVPVISGLPYVYVRGSPPAGTVYYYDGIQVPALFHLALGPAVVHPALIGPIDFYASVAPARYGRYTGGVLTGGFRDRAPPTAANGELELRLIDINGMLQIPIGGGSLSVAGRYGYPGLVVGLFSPDITLNYWDYQTRLSLPIGANTRFELSWFGSYDSAGNVDSRGHENRVTLEFHRLEARLIREIGRFEYGSALQLGYERSHIESGVRISAGRVGPRLWASYRGENGLRFRMGADMFGAVGRLHAPTDQDEAGFELPLRVYDNVAGRSVMGAYAELSLPLAPRLAIDLGLRGDLWLTGSRAEAGADPRASLRFRSHDWIEWHVAAGLGTQPAVFLIPLPGIADVALDHGLQRAIQTEAGVAIDLPAKLRLESQLYAQYLTNMIFPELVLDQMDECDALPPRVADVSDACIKGYPRASAWAYGAEIFLHRAVTERLSGWLSYTLGWARAHADEGYDFKPSFDVRHVLNLVLQYQIGAGFALGARVHYHTGKIANVTFVRAGPIRYDQRLPGFFRADAQLSYSWAVSWAKLRLSLEWLNVTLSREPTEIECRDGVDVGRNPLTSTPCTVVRAPALFFPNLGLRAQF